MMKPETLTAALFSGVQQVVLCSGPAWRNTNPDTVTDPYDPATVFAYSVDSVGVMNVVAAAERHLTPVADMTILNSVDLVPDMSWTDASIGASTSRITPDANGIRMEGTLEQGVRHRSCERAATMRHVGKSERPDAERDDSVGRQLRTGSHRSRRANLFCQRRRTLTLHHTAKRQSHRSLFPVSVIEYVSPCRTKQDRMNRVSLQLPSTRSLLSDVAVISSMDDACCLGGRAMDGSQTTAASLPSCEARHSGPDCHPCPLPHCQTRMGGYLLYKMTISPYLSFSDEQYENGRRFSEQKEPRRGLLLLSCLRFDIQSCAATGACRCHTRHLSPRGRFCCCSWCTCRRLAKSAVRASVRT